MILKVEKSLHKRLFSFSRLEVNSFFESSKAFVRNSFATVLRPKKLVIEQPGRLLVCASRKVGKAVCRNRLRRLCKNIFLAEKLNQYGVPIVVLFKPNSKVDRPELEGLFREIKQKIFVK